MPIRKIEQNGETTYEGLKDLDDVGWADELVIARGDREHVIRELTKHHLYEAEKHRRQCALLAAVVQTMSSDDSDIDPVIMDLAKEVLSEATRLADFHPFAGQDLEVDYDRERYDWIGADGKDLKDALSDCRMAHIKNPRPEPVQDTPGAAKLLDKAVKAKSLDRALRLARKARKLNRRAQARKAKRAA